MQRSFRSEAGIGFFIVLFSGLILFIWAVWSRHPVAAAVCAVLSIFLTQALLRTDYIVRDDGSLFLTAGFLPVRVIPVNSIQRIEIKKGCPGPYSVSFDGMDIIYRQNRRVRVSPKDKAGFISELKKYHPGIQVTDK